MAKDMKAIGEALAKIFWRARIKIVAKRRLTIENGAEMKIW